MTKRTLLLLLTLLLGSLPLIYFGQENYQGDFRAFYVAGVAVNQHLDPYANNSDRSPVLDDIADNTQFSRYIYAPTSLILMKPFGLFSYARARLLFCCLTLMALIVTMVIVAVHFDTESIWLHLNLYSVPVFATMARGQIDALVLLLCVFGWFSSPIFGGLALGAAISVKSFPVVLLLPMLFYKQWKRVLTAVVFCLVVNCSALFAWGTLYYREWLRNLFVKPVLVDIRHYSTIFDNQIFQGQEGWWILNPSIVGGFANPLLWTKSAALPIGCLVYLAIVVLLFYLKTDKDIAYLVAIVGSLWINRLLWNMGIVMCIPAIIALLGRRKGNILASAALVVPLFLPPSFGYRGMSPRFVLINAAVAWILIHDATRKKTHHLTSTLPLTVQHPT